MRWFIDLSIHSSGLPFPKEEGVRKNAMKFHPKMSAPWAKQAWKDAEMLVSAGTGVTITGVSSCPDWHWDTVKRRMMRSAEFLPARIQYLLAAQLCVYSVVVQSLRHVWLFATPWTAAYHASLSFIISQSILKLMSIELVMPSNHLILCHPLLLLPSIFPSIRIFSNELALRIRWLGTSASSSVLPMNIQGWFPLGLIGLISLQSKGLSRVSSSTTVQKCQFFNDKPSLWSTSDLECKMKFHVPGRAMGSLSVLGVGVGSQGKIKWEQGTCEGV